MSAPLPEDVERRLRLRAQQELDAKWGTMPVLDNYDAYLYCRERLAIFTRLCLEELIADSRR